MISIGLTERECKEYSFLKIIRSKIEGRPLDGLEYRASQTVSDKIHKAPQGCFIPADVLSYRTASDYTKGTATAGGDLIQTTLLAQSFIEILIANMAILKLGATVLDGLVGDIAIPKQTGRSSASWVVEDAEGDPAPAVFGQVLLSPKSITCNATFSRKLLLQSSISVEQFVRMDLARSIALGIDYAAIAGSPVSGQPQGIIGGTNVNPVEMGTDGDYPSYDKMIEFISAVALCNALIGTKQGFLTNSSVACKLMTTPKIASSEYPVFVWEGSLNNGTVCGFKAVVSNQIPSNLTKGQGTGLSACIFGCFDQLILGQWGSLDLLVDPYTYGSQGTTKVVCFQDVDLALRHGQSFATSVDIKTA